MGNHYIMTDGYNYVCKCASGNYSVSSNKDNAVVVDKEKANSIISNQLPKMHKDKFKPQKVYVSFEEEKSNVEEKFELSDNLLDWLNRVNAVKEIVQTAIDRKQKLQDEESLVEKEIVDLEHYIEFTKFNACTGYKAADMLKQRLLKRRKIKDEIFAIGQILGKNLTTSDIVQAEKSIKGLDSRLYEPRVLKELFNV